MGQMKQLDIELQNFIQSLPFTPYPYQLEYLSKLSMSSLTGKNQLITLPTGAGKSLGFEYVAHLGKTIYTVPIRELANEQMLQLPDRYPHLRILRDTGQDYANRKEFDYVNQDVIITTNERLLSIMNTSVKERVFEDVKFIVFDEIHMISDVSRGSTLEYIIMLLKKYHPDIILVGLSATLPNYKEFAEWLNADYTYLPREARPVPLEFYLGGLNTKGKACIPVPPHMWRMKQKREYKFGQLVAYTYKFKEQFLVFMSSKRDIEHYARKFAGCADSAPLEELVSKKVAYHHADLSDEQKASVVERFKEGTIRVIFCSPTLAVGVNLPATNCVVFDLSFWNDIAMKHEPQDADKLEQMFGRAGRVGYSEVGRVIILGDEEELATAQDHIDNPRDTFSQFGRVLVDKVLNMVVKEVAINAVDIYSVIKESFLFHQQSTFNIQVIVDALDLLEKYNFILTEDNYDYKTTFKGRMTINMYLKVHTLIDVMHNLSNSQQLKSIYDVWRVLLSHEDFLGKISYDGSTTDRNIVGRTVDYFSGEADLAAKV